MTLSAAPKGAKSLYANKLLQTEPALKGFQLIQNSRSILTLEIVNATARKKLYGLYELYGLYDKNGTIH